MEPETHLNLNFWAFWAIFWMYSRMVSCVFLWCQIITSQFMKRRLPVSDPLFSSFFKDLESWKVSRFYFQCFIVLHVTASFMKQINTCDFSFFFRYHENHQNHQDDDWNFRRIFPFGGSSNPEKWSTSLGPVQKHLGQPRAPWPLQRERFPLRLLRMRWQRRWLMVGWLERLEAVDILEDCLRILPFVKFCKSPFKTTIWEAWSFFRAS